MVAGSRRRNWKVRGFGWKTDSLHHIIPLCLLNFVLHSFMIFQKLIKNKNAELPDEKAGITAMLLVFQESRVQTLTAITLTRPTWFC